MKYETTTDNNDVSMVYANDTVDFGTIDVSDTKNTIDAEKVLIARVDESGPEESESGNDTHVDFEESPTRDRLPQHVVNNRSYNTADTSYNSSGNYLNTAADDAIIDNRKLEYIPIRLACGLMTYCSPDVLRHCPMVLRSVQADLAQAFGILPVAVHSLLRRTNLWLNWNGYAYGPKAHPKILRHISTHHHPSWLTNVACDTPQKALGIEIYSCIDYQNMRLHWNGCGLLLHELCHLIHQCCLEDGLDNPTVEALYERADASGRYERVLRRDWAGKTTATVESTRSTDTFSLSSGGTGENSSSRPMEPPRPADFDLAYAMVDKKEFFAELSVAFLCHGYRGLSKADPTVMEFCSPPLLHHDAIERVRGVAAQHERELAATERATETVKTSIDARSIPDGYSLIGTDGENDAPAEKNATPECCFAPFSAVSHAVEKIGDLLQHVGFGTRSHHGFDRRLSQLLRTIDPVFQERAMSHNCATIYHCNKFYPFTGGQFKYHDPDLYEGMKGLWNEISLWEDPLASMRTRKRLQRPCLRRCPSLSLC